MGAKRRQFTPEFKIKAVRLLSESGKSRAGHSSGYAEELKKN